MKFKEDKNKEAAALLYIFSKYPPLKDRAMQSTDDEEYFQVDLFQKNVADLEGENKVLAYLSVSLFNQETFPLYMFNTLSDEGLNIAFQAIKYCKNGKEIYELEDHTMILKEDQAESDPEEPPEFLGQTQVANLLQENSVDLDRRKVAVYYQRGHLPSPDIMLGKSPGWKKDVIQKWIQDYKDGRVVARRKR